MQELDNILGSIYPYYDSKSLIDLTKKISTYLQDRWPNGLIMSAPDARCCFTNASAGSGLLRIEPSEFTEPNTYPRWFTIDFTGEVLWVALTQKFVRVVIGTPRPAVNAHRRDVYLPILKYLDVADIIKIQRLELYDCAFGEEIMKQLSGLKLRDLVLSGFTYGQCTLIVHPLIEKLAVSVIGENPLTINFSMIKLINTVCLGGGISYHKAISQTIVPMVLPDLYSIIGTVSGTNAVQVQNLVLLMNDLDFAANSMESIFIKFPTIHKLSLCLNYCGEYLPLTCRTVRMPDAFTPTRSLALDKGEPPVVGIQHIIGVLDVMGIQHMAFDARFVTQFMINIPLATIADKFVSMECEYVPIGGRKCFPIVFGDEHDAISVWVWEYKAIEFDQRGKYEVRELPAKAQKLHSCTVNPDTLFRNGGYTVVNRRISQVSLPAVAKPVAKGVQEEGLVKPTGGFFKKLFSSS